MDQIVRQIHENGVILVRLKPESPGSDHYVDDSSSFHYRSYGRIETNMNGCVLVGRGIASGSGTFGTDAEIGATRGDDGMLFCR